MVSGRRGSMWEFFLLSSSLIRTHSDITRDETTASEACAEAPNKAVAKQVEEAANLEHGAAEHAASVAKVPVDFFVGVSFSVFKYLF
jgi:hypothetical protein